MKASNTVVQIIALFYCEKKNAPFIQLLCTEDHAENLEDTWWRPGSIMGSWHISANSGRSERCADWTTTQETGFRGTSTPFQPLILGRAQDQLGRHPQTRKGVLKIVPCLNAGLYGIPQHYPVKKSSFLSLFQIKCLTVVPNYVLLKGSNHTVTNNHKCRGLKQHIYLTVLVARSPECVSLG